VGTYLEKINDSRAPRRREYTLRRAKQIMPTTTTTDNNNNNNNNTKQASVFVDHGHFRPWFEFF
jgi:hypothetical protein